ncbi:MAG TPA: hypothetical protein VMV23_01360 [Candidatus Nanopelagicaceae bacterium]|nr:hypothetical protein [Candidatus Nanopelagicaceae bacterium]
MLQLGMLKRTPRGRMATEGAYRHLGLEVPEELGGGTSEDPGPLFASDS